jgi:hypothetical protein
MLALATGCLSGPVPVCEAALPPAVLVEAEENPVFIPLGPESYGTLFENVLRVLHDYQFEILESNRYDGRIETIPRIAPGLALFLKPGSPTFYDRLLSTMQTYRHRVSVIIQPADNGGFFVEFIARKELEDLPRPVRATAGAAIFRNDNSVERQFEVIDPTFYESTWIYRGRDTGLEQELIRLLKVCR